MTEVIARPTTLTAPAPPDFGLTKFLDPLRIPELIRPQLWWQRDEIAVDLRQAPVRLHSQLPEPFVWSYAGQFPGPTIEVRSGKPPRVALEQRDRRQGPHGRRAGPGNLLPPPARGGEVPPAPRWFRARRALTPGQRVPRRGASGDSRPGAAVARTESMESQMATVNGIRMHYRRAGEGPPVVLLHGWPQTSYCWHKVFADLAARYTMLAPDLRGYGRTDKPRDGYDKRTMAADVSELVRGLGFDRASVVGHDRGGRVAHRWALDRPDEVARLAVLDIIPTREMWRRLDTEIARSYWHWLFHLQPDLPELLAGQNIAAYLGYFFERWTYQRQGLDAAAEYIQAFSAPGALRAGFDDYRASFPTDAAHDDADAGRKLAMPVLALWGETGLLGRLPTLEIWRDYADDVTGVAIAECGHYLPEEQPAVVLDHLMRFLPR